MKLVGFLVAIFLGAVSAEAAEPSAFRVNSVELVEPHVFAGALFLCIDATEQVNGEMASEISTDEDDDGLLDVSLALVFRPMDKEAASTPVEIHVAECTKDDDDVIECTPGDDVVESAAEHPESEEDAPCLAADEDVLGGDGAPAPTNEPCFVTPSETISVTIAGVALELAAARVAAQYDGETRLDQGLLIGFLSEDVAETTIIPDDVPFVGGESMASLFRGGDDNCEDGDDRDLGPNGESGWWLHFNFTASSVPWTE